MAHNSSLCRCPGRDILVQAWYQGGMSVIDFTDSANPVEIAYFDRGPINAAEPPALNLGGLWSTYWYNGHVFGSEIARGFDTFGLLPSDQLSQNEIDAASAGAARTSSTRSTRPQIRGTPSFAVVGRLLRPGRAQRAARRAHGDVRSATASRGAMHLEDVGANPRAIQARLEQAARMVPDSADYLQRALEEFAATLG